MADVLQEIRMKLKFEGGYFVRVCVCVSMHVCVSVGMLVPNKVGAHKKTCVLKRQQQTGSLCSNML